MVMDPKHSDEDVRDVARAIRKVFLATGSS
jgi:hypothetical protein